MNNPHHLTTLLVAVSGMMLQSGCTQREQADTMAMPGNHPAGVEVKDYDVTLNVKVALANDEMLKFFNIGVSTLKGDVLLTGELDNQFQADHAVELVSQVEGVHTIHDHLTIVR